TAMLEQATGFDRQMLAQSLANKGFFLGRGGKLWSNEGDLLFETRKGVRYTLRFGELVLGEGDEVSAGIGPKPTNGGGEDQAAANGDGEAKQPADNRYLMVTAAFVADRIPEPTGARLPKEQLDKRVEAKKAIEEIAAAVGTYRSRNEGKLPPALADLTVAPPEGEPALKALNKDPWDNDYVLTAEGEGF